MGSPAFVARLQIKRRWRSLVAVALFVALAGGLATALIAGARRSSTVVRRYFDAAIPYDLVVGAYPDQPLTRAKLLALPGVRRVDRDTYFSSIYTRPDGTLGDGINSVIYDPAGIDPTFRVLAGRLPDAADPAAVMVNESFTEQFGLGTGDELTVKTFAPRDLADVQDNHFESPHGPSFRFHIAAVIRTPDDVVLDRITSLDNASSYGAASGMLVPSAFYDANHTRFLGFGDAYDVELSPGTTGDAFQRGVSRSVGPGVYFGPARFAERRASFDTPVDLETGFVLALGIATAVAGAVVTALLLRTEQRAHEADDLMLSALGTTRAQRGAIAVLRTAPFAVIGAVLAGAIAVALSGRFPIGVGRLLELHGGVNVNVVVLLCSLLAVVMFTTVVAFALEWRTRRAERPTPTRARGGIARVLQRNGAPPEMAIGTRFAFGGDSARVASSGPVIAASALVLAVVVALGVFLAGTDHLNTNSSAHGWPWDAVIGNVNFTMPKAREAAIVRDPRVAAATSARYGQATVGGISTEVLAYDPAGTAPPEMLRGRAPTHADEIAPGARLLRELHAHIGDTVTLSLADGELAPQSGETKDRELTVVGASLPPVIGESDFGETAVVPLSAIRAGGGPTSPQLVLTRLRGKDRIATARELARDYTPEIMLDNVPSRVVNLNRVRSLPVLGALVAALFGTMLLAYTLAVGARRRVHQLGILRALGMNARRVGRVLVWQGVTLALAVTIIGIPLGIALGSVAWRTFANGLGIATSATVPWSVLLLIPGTIAVGVLAAVVPAYRARRQPVSELLRVE
jgi:hypothetical protein